MLQFSFELFALVNSLSLSLRISRLLVETSSRRSLIYFVRISNSSTAASATDFLDYLSEARRLRSRFYD